MAKTGWKRMQTAGGYYERLYSGDSKMVRTGWKRMQTAGGYYERLF